jgi:hypothetical protein
MEEGEKEIVLRVLNYLQNQKSLNRKNPDKSMLVQALKRIISGEQTNIDPDEVPTRTATDKDVENISSFSFSRLELSDASATAGAFLGSQNELINSIFAEQGVVSRLQKMSQVSKESWDLINGGTPTGSNRENIQKLMFVDLVNSMVNEIDSRAGAYFFEGFCALLFGGKVVGGSMGGADFEIGETKGSSKFYSDWKGFGQAVQNFEAYSKNGTLVHYVIVIKNKLQDTLSEEEESLREGAVQSFNLHYIGVKPTQSGGAIKFELVDYKGFKIDEKIQSRGKLNLSDVNYREQSLIGSFDLYSGTTENFSQSIDASLKDEGAMSNENKLKDTLKIVRDYFDHMFKAEENTKKYINMTRDNPREILDVGQEALNQTDKAQGELSKLVVSLSPKTSGKTNISGTAGDRKVTEQKITANFLKKIIAESFKK